LAEHEEIKQRTRAVWALGDYTPIADMLRPAAQDLVDAAAISAGQEVLDVGAGTGNLALIAASEGASVVASDLTPEMVEKGRARTEAEGVDVQWVVADAEDLPFEDARFDCVASVFGAIFAPRPEVMIGELFRVVRPGNTVALTAWGDYGVQAQIFQRFDRFRPMPEGVPKPSLWGDEDVVRERLAPYANTVRAERVTIPVSFDSADDLWRAFSGNGPLVALRQALPAEQFDALGDEVREVVKPYTNADGRVKADAEYLRIVARKRG
jgi:SAM-dependent methyltransferase